MTLPTSNSVMIELYLLIRYFILKPLGLIKDSDDEQKRERDWLEKIGYYDKNSKK